jgi:hypothetical protein
MESMPGVQNTSNKGSVLIDIAHLRDALSKAQVINEAETPSH